MNRSEYDYVYTNYRDVEKHAEVRRWTIRNYRMFDSNKKVKAWIKVASDDDGNPAEWYINHAG